MGEKQWWNLNTTRAEDTAPERDTNLENCHCSPPAILCLGAENSPSHSLAFNNTQGVNGNQTCFSDLLSGWS